MASFFSEIPKLWVSATYLVAVIKDLTRPDKKGSFWQLESAVQHGCRSVTCDVTLHL